MKTVKSIFTLLICIIFCKTTLHAQNAAELMQIADDMLQMDGNSIHFIMNDGTIHYKNGEVESGKIKYQVGMSYNSLGSMQLILENKMKPVIIYPSDVNYVEIGTLKFFPIKLKDDKGSYNIFAASLSKNIDDKMVMFRLYKDEYSTQSPGKIYLQKDLCVITTKEDKSVILGPIGGTLGITPFNKFMSKMLDDCADLAKKIKDKEDGYKVSLIDLKNVNQDVYLKILEEYNACK